MSAASRAHAVAGATPALVMRRHFMGWQCRLRQFAVRRNGGRPGAGMRPEITIDGENRSLGRVTMLIVRREPEITAELRHLCKRTFDPADRYASAVQYLSAAYYQQPDCFESEMTALFGQESSIAAALIEKGSCRLCFEQYSQRYEFRCKVRGLDTAEPAFQATYWHNTLFNPELPGNVSVLGFSPDWVTAVATPPLD